MPTAEYEELLLKAQPEVINTAGQYAMALDRFSGLIRKGRARTDAETRLMRLLGLLVQDYDRRNGMPPDESTAAERLVFLLEHSGKTTVDLLPVFGQKSHISEALKGKRPISADQARKLGKLFCVKPGIFL